MSQVMFLRVMVGLMLVIGLWLGVMLANSGAAPAPETVDYVTRARIVMDLLKDNEVTESDNYTSDKVDFLDGPTSINMADAFCIYYGKYQNGTNQQKAGFFIQSLKKHCKRIRLKALERQQENSQQEANQTTITNELGTDESP